MLLKFWGTRGSIPTPGKETVRYGGNTSCIQVSGDDGTTVILDAGTGIRELGNVLVAKSPLEVHLFLSHTHWDHIHGFPFFTPAYVPANKINCYGPKHFNLNTQQIMARQMEYDFFPVRADELCAQIKYKDIQEETIKIGDLSIQSKMMNHPVTCYGYRVNEREKSIFYTGDHEKYYNFVNVEDTESDSDKEEIDAIVKEQNERTIQFAKGVDILVADTQYLNEEYPSRVGWGHSSTFQSVEFAIKSGVKHLVLFHHEPTRSDEKMDLLLEEARNRAKELGYTKLKISAAAEGVEIPI